MPDRVGQRIGNYRLMELLGCGGFACVYLGQHVDIRKQAAIKILKDEVKQQDQDKFLQEAEKLERLKHPHIVHMLEFGRIDSDRNNPSYLIMEYAPGRTLRHRHPKGTILPLTTAVDYVHQIAGALQYVHDHSLIHRDLKPENLLIGATWEILLSDLGIAFIVDGGSSDMETGAFAGTVPYSAPEQIRNKPRRASDQYSLGIIIYEWLTGECPFQGRVEEIISQHFYDTPPSLRKKVPTIPSEIEAIVLKALSKEPEDRFASVQEFAQVLEAASKTSTERFIDAAVLMQSLDDILDDISRNGVVYIVMPDADFVIGPENICGRVLGLVDPEYGWPFPIEVKNIKSVSDIVPRWRGHPFICRNGVCLAVSIQMTEYEQIKKKYPHQQAMP